MEPMYTFELSKFNELVFFSVERARLKVNTDNSSIRTWSQHKINQSLAKSAKTGTTKCQDYRVEAALY